MAVHREEKKARAASSVNIGGRMELKIYNPQEDGFLKQIEWNFEELKREIGHRSEEYLNLVYSENQMKEAKKDRAALRKLVTALEDKRKEIKKQVMVPYQDFEKKEKELVSIINEAVDNIDAQVKGYEEGLRQDKQKKVEEIYKECIGDLDRTVPLEKIFKDSWLNASTTLKSIREEISGIYQKVDTDLKLINAETSKYSYEMKEEYLKNLDFSAAMAKKQELEETEKRKTIFEEQRKKEAEEREQKRRMEAEAVESAGKAESGAPVASYIDTDGNPVAELPKERILAITFRISAKESKFGEVNKLIAQLQKCCESFEMLEKEEL